ncbi:hypothetical protein CMV_029419 [Castanea mollissima]|uniref:Uncharacterized protein n=1 Tax=Castanea mollissima TaxID=60419 RepID=A0A8J4Q349_9ROSI|nr:hypothetical protein CMV_029419 [Castanea mollissima]
MTCFKEYRLMLMLAGQGILTATGVAFMEEIAFFRSWLPKEIAVDLGHHQGIIILGLAFALFQRVMPVDFLVGECDMFWGIMNNICSVWPSENCSNATLALKISLTSISKRVTGVSVVFYLHYFGCKEKEDEKTKAGEEEPIPLFGNEHGIIPYSITVLQLRFRYDKLLPRIANNNVIVFSSTSGEEAYLITLSSKIRAKNKQ